MGGIAAGEVHGSNEPRFPHAHMEMDIEKIFAEQKEKREFQKTNILQCSCCNKKLPEIKFYHFKDGAPSDICKECETVNIDDYNPLTILPLCKKYDIPYISQEWWWIIKKAEKRLQGEKKYSEFGRYLALMKLQGWKSWTFKDTQELNKR